MKVKIRNSVTDYDSYRAARIKSLFNCESGANFSLDAEIPLNDDDWSIGVVVGPSGSGKTSIGKEIWQDVGIYDGDIGWPKDKPIIDAIAPDGDFDSVTGALSAVGLGSVPSWLRPYGVLSNGEKFRAGMARIVAEGTQRVIIDEFTSVVDRQVAKIGASAFQKAYRRTGGKAILLSCHYDILDWLEPDWIFDTASGKLERGRLRRRPEIKLEVYEASGNYWPSFEKHHYLKIPRPIAPKYYVGFVNGTPVAHIATTPNLQSKGMRVCRIVVMPEWQGAGLGMKFINLVSEMQFTKQNKYHRRVQNVYLQTSHPALCNALRRDKRWVQISQSMGGVNKGKSKKSISGSGKSANAGYGGHLRAVQGFKMQKSKVMT